MVKRIKKNGDLLSSENTMTLIVRISVNTKESRHPNIKKQVLEF
jgi:hypothetical protein